MSQAAFLDHATRWVPKARERRWRFGGGVRQTAASSLWMALACLLEGGCRGAQVKDRYREVERTIGVVRAAVSVRYTRP